MKNTDSKWDARRIASLVGIILIVIMVIATLLAAIFDKSGVYFRSCLIVVVALPIALWVFIWALGAMTNKHTVATFDFLQNQGKEDSEEDN